MADHTDHPQNDVSDSSCPRCLFSRPGVLGLVLLTVTALLGWQTYQRYSHTAPSEPYVAAGIHWQVDLAEAQATATKTRQPIFVRFSAAWCPPCQQMKRDVYPDPTVSRLLDEKFVAVDIDLTNPQSAGKTLASQLDVQYLPSMVILSAQGDEIDRIAGGVDRNTLQAWLKRHQDAGLDKPLPPSF